MNPLKSDDIIRRLLREKCRNLESLLKADVMLIRAPMVPGIDDTVRREIEPLGSSEAKRAEKLAVVLETEGGSIETVERIHDVMRHHYNVIVFIIPNYAYSAGTVLVLSGDDIYMDYYSVLGPIDPQIRNKDGRWVPGLGYLEKFDELVEKSKNKENSITYAELEFLVRKFDAAELFALEMAKKHSEDLIEKWLSEYKFKDWNKKETSGTPVSPDEKRERARDIAKLLGDPTKWNSHSRGIPLSVLTSSRVKLKIKDFGEDKKLNKAMRDYYDLLVDYTAKIGAEMVIHTRRGFWTSRRDR